MRVAPLPILLALLIGVLAPLCCCRAAALAGVECGSERAEAMAVVDACCPSERAERDAGGRSSGEGPSRPTDDDSRTEHPGGCDACPTCRGGGAGGAGLGVEAKPAPSEPQWDELATLALAALLHAPERHAPIATRRPAREGGPPHLRANRAALRWHCALTV